ncbi:MAG TPA: tRNA (adenosine(37)-N6)-threonylcarbamoyltransferase complex ATPase subunit type 1 TsaE [Planctomycetaceae bacterium]|nr:tRNA (adenosine(37)-N6)-threonylcarbamoyltransferase complex ATPase subunit type 1 TsaE [Planctomycetaceae bacterium]
MDTSPSERWTFRSASEANTFVLGERLGAALEPGSVVALVGELGAGKTRLVQGIAAGLGVQHRWVNSPTFALIQEYAGRLHVYHFDTYRLRSVTEFLELGAEEYLSGDGVCLIEWADRVTEVLPVDVLRVQIEVVGESERMFQFTATGPRAAGVLDKLRPT